MKKEYGRYLRTVFERSVSSELEGFELYPSSGSKMLWPGERVFSKKYNEDLECFIIMVPDPGGMELFRIEAGWSSKSRIPQLNVRPSINFLNKNRDLLVAEAIFRASFLWDKNDITWVIEELNLQDFNFDKTPAEGYQEKIDFLVSDFIKKAKDFILPFFGDLSKNNIIDETIIDRLFVVQNVNDVWRGP